MASIIKRGKRYRALVRKKGITQCHSFQTKTAAKTWATRIEAELELLSTGSRLPVKGWTVGDIIDRYATDIKPIKNWSPSKDSHFNTLKRHIGDKPASAFGVEMVLFYARERLNDGVSSSTLAAGLSYLSSAVKYARNTLRLNISVEAIAEARSALSDNGMLDKPKTRERRPTEKELELLREYFTRSCWKIPMVDILDFAISSGMRRGEICRIRWDDLDTKKKTIIIRNRKHPTKKLGNDQTVPLLGDAFDIVMCQPRLEDRIFPVTAQIISDTFVRGCKVTGIEGLHFHDMRHHALSILFEQGYQIQEVCIVSGHTSWDMLKRYTHIKPESLHRRIATS